MFKNFISLFCALLFFIAGCQNRREKGPPNIIFILVDDLGWRDVGYMGSMYYETPNIDRLAGMGMAFTNAYAACAVCSPTRASIMTGKYPARLGLTDWIHFLDPQASEAAESGRHPEAYVGGMDRALLCPPNPYWMDLEETTIAEVLKAHGYVTAHIGKWHLGPRGWWPENQGFDYNFGGADLGQPPSYFDPYHRNEVRPGIPTLDPRREGEYLTDREASEAVRFIHQHKDTSFFLNLWHYAVHTPIQAKDSLVSKYAGKTALDGQDNPAYAAMIESVDEALGMIVQTLTETGLLDHTIVVFFSDNGGLVPVTSNAPLKIGKGYPYEGGIREPMFVYWPGVVEPETVCDVPVSSVDFFPTLLQMAGIERPEDPELDGMDLVPLLSQNGGIGPRSLFWHFPHYRGTVVPYGIIRKDDYKLIRHYEGDGYELYHLAEDLSESYNLADSLPAMVDEMNLELEQWLASTSAKMPVPNAAYRKPEKVDHVGMNNRMQLEYLPAEPYRGNGAESLLDGWRAGAGRHSGWVGFEGDDLTATITMKDADPVSMIEIDFLRDQDSWIFLPEKVTVEVSNDGKNFVMVDEKVLGDPDPENSEIRIETVAFSFYPKDHQYLRIRAQNIHVCPLWHRGAGGKAWLFADEIVIH
jgi:arylsulfatase A-like enzyme